jgi:hypothetical protein
MKTKNPSAWPFHEPRGAAVPAASCGGVSPPARTPGETPGKLAGEDACATAAGQFMVPMHSKKRKGAFHEAQGAAGILPAEKSEKSSADETSAAPCLWHGPICSTFSSFNRSERTLQKI